MEQVYLHSAKIGNVFAIFDDSSYPKLHVEYH